MKKIIAFYSIVLLSFQSVAQTPQKPNIILIVVDDMGWGDVGYHGGKIPTPNINQLATDGIELNRFYTAAVCSPTRAGLMTGRYPDRFGLRKTVIPPWSTFGVSVNEVFLPELLAKAGYQHRAMIGKWHLGHADVKYHPLKRGFTHFYGHLNGAIDYFTHYREGELDWHNDFESSYDKGYATDLLANEAVKNIKAYNGSAPFFIYLAFNAPHSPLQAKLEDLKKFGFDATKPKFAKATKEGVEGRGNTKAQTYAAMVSNLDSNIGRILKTLKELKIDDNTLVIFQSDNGPAPGEGGSSGILRGTKFTEWEGGVRVPAIIKWPKGITGGWKCEQVTGYVDVLPTILAAAQMTDKPKNELDGINILPVLNKQNGEMDRSLFLGSGAIVSAYWKLIAASGENPRMKFTDDQFFNIKTDQTEKKNVKEQNQKEYNSLQKQLIPFSAIKSPVEVADYGEGSKGFIAPKEWKIPIKKD